MKRCRMAVINAKCGKVLGHQSDIACHMFPQERIIRGASSVAQLHAVAPRDYFSPQVGSPFWTGIVLHSISCPNPTIYSKSEGFRIMVFRDLIHRQPREVAFNQRVLFSDRTKFGPVGAQTKILQPTFDLVQNRCDIYVVLTIKLKIEFVDDVDGCFRGRTCIAAFLVAPIERSQQSGANTWIDFSRVSPIYSESIQHAAVAEKVSLLVQRPRLHSIDTPSHRRLKATPRDFDVAGNPG